MVKGPKFILDIPEISSCTSHGTPQPELDQGRMNYMYLTKLVGH